MSTEEIKLALDGGGLYEITGRIEDIDKCIVHRSVLVQLLENHIPDATKMVSGVKDSLTTQQEQDEPLPDFYITEKMADSIYKLKSPDWALCISGNKSPTMHKNIPVFVGYVKTKPVEQEQGEPVAWESVLGAVARGWCYEENANKTMDSELAVAIAKEVHALYTTPRGCNDKK